MVPKRAGKKREMESTLPTILSGLNWPHPGLRWIPFDQIDQLRCFYGELFDLLGMWPRRTQSRIVFRKPVLTLRAYASNRNDGPVVLIIPAPIKRSYIWDLAPEASVVQQFVRNDISVYLAQWEQPGVDEQTYGLAEYADQLLLDCLHAIEKETGQRRIFLVGHSLGGTLAAIFSTLHPERLAGLILAGAPLHFGPKVDPLSSLVAASPCASSLNAMAGSVPGSVLDLASILAAPATFGYFRWMDWLVSLPNAQTLETHLRVERWTGDEMPLARRFFEEVVEWLYREDRFMRGTLKLDGLRATPESARVPLLCIVERQSAVAPPESVRPFYKAVRSRQKRWLWYEGDIGVSLQHVGMLVGRTAHQFLWPDVVRWIRQHAKSH
ncbi:MAG: poly(3-hydroxybutyrate) synthase subunit [Pedosphaera sp.]|nr:poly(3-hydroxybutyrate) synthase subunit [Pedosphaera sp.]